MVLVWYPASLYGGNALNQYSKSTGFEPRKKLQSVQCLYVFLLLHDLIFKIHVLLYSKTMTDIV